MITIAIQLIPSVCRFVKLLIVSIDSGSNLSIVNCISKDDSSLYRIYTVGYSPKWRKIVEIAEHSEASLKAFAKRALTTLLVSCQNLISLTYLSIWQIFGFFHKSTSCGDNQVQL